MWVTCSCDKQLKFEVTGPDKERLEQAMSAGQRMLMIKCGACSKNIPVNPRTLTPQTTDGDRKYACPTSGCDGLIVHVDGEGESFWGCGECGSVWADERTLSASGAKIVDSQT